MRQEPGCTGFHLTTPIDPRAWARLTSRSRSDSWTHQASAPQTVSSSASAGRTSSVHRARHRRANCTIKRPLTNLTDLLPHGTGQGDNRSGGTDQIFARDLSLLELRFGQCRYDTLLDLGPSPVFSETNQLLEIKSIWIHAPAFQVNPKDLDSFAFEWQINEKYFVETPFPNHLGRQKVDSVRRRSDE